MAEYVPSRNRIQIRIQDFDDQNLKKIYIWKKVIIFFYQKLQFTGIAENL